MALFPFLLGIMTGILFMEILRACIISLIRKL